MADKIITAGIEIQAGVSGTKDISNLSAELKAMGVDTRELDEKSQTLAASFRQLARQQQLINQFKSLKQASQENAAALDKQQAAVQRLAAQMRAAPSKKLAADFERAKNSAARLKAKQIELRNALHESRKALNDNGISSKKLAAAQTRLNEKTRFLSQQTQSVAEHLKRTRNELNKTASATERASRSSDNTAKSFGGISGRGGAAAAAIAAVAYAAKRAIDEFVRIDAKFDRMERAFTEVTGSSAGATVEMQRLIDISNRLGITFSDIADDYTGFLASAKGANIEFEQSSEIFEKTAQKLLSMGKSTDEVGGVLLAFSQILSKGKVSTEELNQVAERLPGAFKLAADSVGLTTSEFRKMVEKGELLASDFLPKFADQLTVTANAQETNAQTNAKLANQWDLFVKSLDNTLGVSDGVQAATQNLTSALEYLTIETDESREATRKANEEYAKQQEVQKAAAKAAAEAAEAAKQQKAANDANIAHIDTLRQQLATLREQGKQNTEQYRLLDEQFNQSLVSAINYTGELESAGKVLDNSATAAREAAEAQKAAFDAVGLSVDELTTGITQAEQAILNGFGTATQYINNTATSAEHAGQMMERYLVGAMANIKTPEGLKAFIAKLESMPQKSQAVEDVLTAMKGQLNQLTPEWVRLGDAISKATKHEQLQKLAEEAKKAFDASKLSAEQYKQRLEDINTAKRGLLVGNQKARIAAEKSAEATQTDADATKAATEATKASAEAKEQAAEATEKQAVSTQKLYDTTNLTKEQLKDMVGLYEKYRDISYNRFLHGFDSDFRDEIRQTADAYREINDEISSLDKKISAGTISVNDLSTAFIDAKNKAKSLDDVTMARMEAALDRAKAKIKELAETARSEVADLEAELASVKGDDTLSRELEQKRKLAALEEKLADARARNSREEIAAYERAIRLQQQIFAEKEKQIRAEEQQRNKQQKNRQENSNTNDGGKSSTGGSIGKQVSEALDSLPLPAISVDTADLATSLAKSIAARETELGKQITQQVKDDITKEIQTVIKGRGY